MAATSLASIRVGPVRSRVQETLREGIISGRLLPGSPLREAHLARDLGVSQASVREALLQLEHAGLVVRTPNKETVVTRMSEEEIRERGELRALLEGMAAVQAAQRLERNDLNALESQLSELDVALQTGDYFRFSAADLEFHRMIWRFSGNRTLQRTLEQLTVPLFAFLSIRRSRSFDAISRTVRPHKPLLRAMKSKDAGDIRKAFQDHIEGSYKRLLELPE